MLPKPIEQENKLVEGMKNREREMGNERLKVGIQIKRGLMFSTRICYRSVCNHPFLVGFVFFLIFLYRSFPFVFSILVSSSPVLVCTILLLGTLLSFGQPHIPEIEKEIEKEAENEEKITHEIAALKSHSGVLEDAVVVDERGETCDVDRYTGKGVDVVDNKAIEDRGLEDIDVSKIEKDDGLDECAPLIEESSREIHSEKPVIEEEEGESHDFQHGPTEEINGEKLRIKEVEADAAEAEDVGESEVEAAENQYTLLKSLEDEDHEVVNDKSPAGSVSPLMEDHLLESSWKHLEDDNEPSDLGSDGGESSSPDASLTDIMPLLDELHPLLDSEAPQPALVSHDDSDAASELSQSNDGSAESSEDSENQDEDDAVDEGDDEEDNEKEADVTKSAIIWTEDDQKNLMDLGTSELERNLRLENLIMRRRARKNMKAMVEKNLIDLESVDPPFYVPPISTGRRNPFDSPCDSYDDMGLPPIPGSAPSVLAPRRNPFDLPYDSSEEKPDLKGDSFDQEFMAFHQRDILFRRHESFSLGASSFGGSRQEKQHTKWRPYFVPEQSSYAIFERQSSGFSDSKASSVPETESVSSAVNDEDIKLIHEDVSQQIEVMSNINCVPDNVEDGGQSSEDSHSQESDQVEKTEIDLNVVAQAAEEVDHLEIESTLATPIELDMNEVNLEAEAGEEKYSRSSSPRLSEVTDQSFDLKSDEESLILDAGKAEIVEKSGVQIQPSQEGSDLSITPVVVVERHHKDPVYDSSPPAVEKNASSLSISNDLAVEMPEIAVATTVSSEVSKEIMESASSNEETWATSSQWHTVDENESRTGEVQEMSKQVSTDSCASAADTAPVEVVVMHKDDSFQDEQNQADQFNIGVEFQTREVHQQASDSRDLMTSTDLNIPSERITFSAVEEQHPSLAVEQVSVVHPNLSSSETNLLRENSADKMERKELEHHQLLSSGYNAKIGDNQDVDEKLVSIDVPNLSSSETKSLEGVSTRMEETVQFEHDQVTPPISDAKPGDQVEEELVSADVSNLSSLETKALEEDSMMMAEKLQSVPSLGSDATTGHQHNVNWKQVSQDFPNLPVSETKSVEENSSGEVRTLQDQVPAQVSGVNIGDHQNGDEKAVDLESSDLSSSEMKFAHENSRGNKETVQFEHDQVHLPSSDAKISGHQDDKKLSDDYQNVSSSEMSLSEPEKLLPSSLSDESAAKPSLDNHEEPHVS